MYYFEIFSQIQPRNNIHFMIAAESMCHLYHFEMYHRDFEF